MLISSICIFVLAQALLQLAGRDATARGKPVLRSKLWELHLFNSKRPALSECISKRGKIQNQCHRAEDCKISVEYRTGRNLNSNSPVDIWTRPHLSDLRHILSRVENTARIGLAWGVAGVLEFTALGDPCNRPAVLGRKNKSGHRGASKSKLDLQSWYKTWCLE